MTLRLFIVFQPKLVQRCAFIPLFLCAKFQGNRILRSRFIVVFVSVQKEEEKQEKNEETKPIFEVAYLGNA